MTLKELAEMIGKFNSEEGLSPAALGTLMDFSEKALSTSRTAASAEQTAVPTGWKLVPLEPTEDMLAEMIGGCDCYHCVKRRYASVLSVAPQPPQQPSAAPESEQKPQAYVPIHPRTGEILWANTIPTLDLPHPSYEMRPVFLKPAAPATLSEEVMRQKFEEFERSPTGSSGTHMPKDKIGNYRDSYTQCLWRRWKEAWQLAAAGNSQSQAARDVLAERARQVEAEGMELQYDDKYKYSELQRAAACYVLHGTGFVVGQGTWPWADSWWKPTTQRRNLVKAGALIQAAIETIDRAAMPKQEGGEGA